MYVTVTRYSPNCVLGSRSVGEARCLQAPGPWMYLAIVVSITPCVVSPMEQLIENIAFAVARAFGLTCPVMVSPRPSLETLLCSRRCGRRTKRPGFPKIPFLLVSQDVCCGSFHGSQVCKTSPLLPKPPDGMYQNGSLYSIMPSKLCVLGAQRLHRRGAYAARAIVSVHIIPQLVSRDPLRHRRSVYGRGLHD